jgi:hypothetical protein
VYVVLEAPVVLNIFRRGFSRSFLRFYFISAVPSLRFWRFITPWAFTSFHSFCRLSLCYTWRHSLHSISKSPSSFSFSCALWPVLLKRIYLCTSPISTIQSSFNILFATAPRDRQRTPATKSSTCSSATKPAFFTPVASILPITLRPSPPAQRSLKWSRRRTLPSPTAERFIEEKQRARLHRTNFGHATTLSVRVFRAVDSQNTYSLDR